MKTCFHNYDGYIQGYADRGHLLMILTIIQFIPSTTSGNDPIYQVLNTTTGLQAETYINNNFNLSEISHGVFYKTPNLLPHSIYRLQPEQW